MDKPVIIFGASGLGKAALDIFQSNNVVVYGFLDDDKSLHNTEINDIPVLGSTDDAEFLKIIGNHCDAFIATDENKYRKSLTGMLKEDRKTMPMNAVHDSAVVSAHAHFGYGNFVNAGVIIGSNAKIANHCLLHTRSIVDFGSELGDFVQLGSGSVINSNVKVEAEVFIGSGVIIVSGVTIGKGARIGAGSVVIADVKAKKTVFGNPAKEV